MMDWTPARASVTVFLFFAWLNEFCPVNIFLISMRCITKGFLPIER